MSCPSMSKTSSFHAFPTIYSAACFRRDTRYAELNISLERCLNPRRAQVLEIIISRQKMRALEARMYSNIFEKYFVLPRDPGDPCNTFRLICGAILKMFSVAR